MRLDKKGNLLWQKKFGGGADDEITSIIISGDNFVAAGFSTDIASNDKQLWMLKVSGTGELIGDYTAGNKLPDGASEIIDSGNNTFICAGWTESFGAGKSDGWLLNIPEKFEGAPKQIIVGDKDIDGPKITIISPTPDEKGVVMVEANKSRQITGKVEDASGILDLTINGNKITTNAEGLFVANLSQTETNAKIRAIDKLGNYSEQNIFFSTGGKLEPLNSVISNISNYRTSF